MHQQYSTDKSRFSNCSYQTCTVVTFLGSYTPGYAIGNGYAVGYISGFSRGLQFWRSYKIEFSLKDKSPVTIKRITPNTQKYISYCLTRVNCFVSVYNSIYSSRLWYLNSAQLALKYPFIRMLPNSLCMLFWHIPEGRREKRNGGVTREKTSHITSQTCLKCCHRDRMADCSGQLCFNYRQQNSLHLSIKSKYDFHIWLAWAV